MENTYEAVLTEGFQYLASSLSASQKGLARLDYADLSVILEAIEEAGEEASEEDKLPSHYVQRRYHLTWYVSEPITSKEPETKPAIYLPE